MSLLTLAPLPTLVVVSLAAVALAGCDAPIHIGADTTRRVERESVAAGGVRAIDISTDSGRVDVVGGAHADTIAIDVVITEHGAADADYSIDVAGGVLDIDGECDGGWFNPCSVGFVVTVPDAPNGEPLAARDVTVAIGNGRITLAQLDVPIDVRTDNGAIAGDHLGADAVHARTDNGRIDLTFGVAPTIVDVRTDNGRIDLLVPEAAYAVAADSDNGRVEVGVTRDDTAPRSIVAASDNGAVDIGVSG